MPGDDAAAGGDTLALNDRIEDVVHEPTQAHDDGFDLTVAAIEEVVDPGRIDFGGGELDDALLGSVPTQKRDPDDDHAWWTLDAGRYVVTYNESLVGDDPVWLMPRDALLDRGASHPSLRVTELPKVPLSVGGAGLKVKENARVSTLTPL